MLAGTYHLIQGESKRIDAVADGSNRFVVLRHDNLYVKYLGYDLSRDLTPACSARPNPFKNRLVRRAIDLAIDRSRLVGALSAHAVPLFQPVPRFVFGFNPRIPETVLDGNASRALLEREICDLPANPRPP